jgi:hypothetical protein
MEKKMKADNSRKKVSSMFSFRPSKYSSCKDNHNSFVISIVLINKMMSSFRCNKVSLKPASEQATEPQYHSLY